MDEDLKLNHMLRSRSLWATHCLFLGYWVYSLTLLCVPNQGFHQVTV